MRRQSDIRNTDRNAEASDFSRKPTRRQWLGIWSGATLAALAGCLGDDDSDNGDDDDSDGNTGNGDDGDSDGNTDNGDDDDSDGNTGNGDDDGSDGNTGNGDDDDSDDNEAELGDTLRIGVLAPAAETNVVGASIRGGAQVAVNELDEEGVLDAEHVEMYVGTTEGTSGGATEAYEDLVLEEDVHFTIGPFASEAFNGIMDNIVAEQKLHLTTGASSMDMNERLLDEYEANKYMFRVGPFNGELLGQAVVDFAGEYYQDVLGWDSTYLLYEQADWTNPIAPVLEDQLDDHGFEVVGSQAYSPTTENFGPIFEDIPNDVDGVTTLMAHSAVNATVFWAQGGYPWGFGGINVPAQNAALPESAAAAFEGVWTLNTATPGTNITEQTESFTQRFQDQTDTFAPVYTAYIAYDAIKLYAQYAEEVGTINEDDMVEAMASNQLTPTTTTTQEFEFYGADHEEYPHDVQYSMDDWVAGRSAPFFNQWQDRELVTILPEAHRQAPYQPHQ